MVKAVGIGRSHSKIILIGEHAVVYGFPAIALPLKAIEVTCRILPSDQRLVFDQTDPLSTAIFAALRYLEIKDHPISFDISSQVPQKRGMGSSAAVAIAAIRAVFDYFEVNLTKDTLEMLVNQAEIIAHQNPSGLDAKTCLSDQAVIFTRQKGFGQVDIDLGAYLVIADTGIYGHTREAVEKVRALGDQALVTLDQLGLLAEQFENHLRSKNLPLLGDFMFQAHAYLADLGVSCPEADHLVEVARGAGALGAKMSGGGLGGCVIALTQDLEEAKLLQEKMQAEGAVQTWVERL